VHVPGDDEDGSMKKLWVWLLLLPMHACSMEVSAAGVNAVETAMQDEINQPAKAR
jgi:hypothetical protein